MKTKIFYKQMSRAFKTVCTCGLILLVVTAFFVMSLNLYNSSVKNLQKAEDTYSTIAVMELQGDVDRRGRLVDVESESYIGYQTVAATGYDLEQILGARGVLGYDLRARYAAYIEGEAAMSTNDGYLMASQDIIRFKLLGDEPIRLPNSWTDEYLSFNRSEHYVDLEVVDWAADCLKYEGTQFSYNGIGVGVVSDPENRDYYAEQVKRLNRSDEVDYVTLYPGVEYIAHIELSSGWHTKEDSRGLLVGSRILNAQMFGFFSEDFYVDYYGGTEDINYTFGREANAPYPVARWEDVQNDPVLKEQWSRAWESINYNMCSFNVCLTDDIAGVPVFHLGGAYLADGRAITAEEYASGAKVCMISRKLSNLQGLHVGSKVKMDLYRFEAFPNTDYVGWGTEQPVYHKNTQGFFDSGEYEIVGIFDKKELTGNSGIAEGTMAMPWTLIFMPHNSVRNALPEEALPVHGALLTLWLENGSVDDFLADMDALGVTQQQEGRYNAQFTFYDQGYSIIQPSLQSMHGTARLLLILSALLLCITCLLLAYFFGQTQKHNIGIFRMLGGKKRQAIAAVLVCALAVTVLGAVPGAVIGHRLTGSVGADLLAADGEDALQNAAYRANVLTAKDTAPMELTVYADADLSAQAACCGLLFPLLILVFVLGYIGKEPRELLPKNKT